MTIYVVMRHAPGCPDVPVSAWPTMTEATLDMIERENHDRYQNERRAYTVTPVTLGGKRDEGDA